MTIELQPRLLQWARQRAGLSVEELAAKVGTEPARVNSWEQEGGLTFKQAEKVAQVTHTPFGYLFLEKPPEERMPIPDFRTVGGKAAQRPSPDLLDVIYQSQRRQEWFREYLVAEGAGPLDFVGSLRPETPVEKAAAAIRERLGYAPSASKQSALDGVLREFAEAAEGIGILVVRGGTVGNNTRRALRTEEFRGFALVDPYAPLVFINAADYKAAQIFTLAHELAHVWAGVTALSNLERSFPLTQQRAEVFCNAVAAEYLVPLADLKQRVKASGEPPEQLVEALRKHYRVSELVIIRRLHDAGQITREQFQKWYGERLAGYAREERSTGGDFYRNQPNKIGRRFAQALITHTLEGKTLLRDALALMDMKKPGTFLEFARTLKFSV